MSSDLWPSKGMDLRHSEVFLVGRLLTARVYNRQSFLGMFSHAWKVNGMLKTKDVDEDKVLFSLILLLLHKFFVGVLGALTKRILL